MTDMPQRPVFVQGPRDKRRIPQGEVKIPPPDSEPQEPETQIMSLLLPASLTVVGLVVMIAVSSSMGGGQALWLSMAISVPMMLGSYLVSYLNYRSRRRNYEQHKQERVKTYEEMLDRQRTRLADLEENTRKALLHNNPGLPECLRVVRQRDSHRMWARAPNDDDFLDLRIGLGEVPLGISIDTPEQNPLRNDPLVDLARSLSEEFEMVSDAPITLPLADAGVTGISGPRHEVLNAARALSVQIATHHSPEDVKVVAIYPAEESEGWAWLRWLPHVWSNDRERRYLAHDADGAHELLALIQQELEDRKHQLDEKGDLMLGTPLPVWVFLLAAPQLVQDEPIYPLLLKHGRALGAFSIFVSGRSSGLPKLCKVMARLEDNPPIVARDVAGGEGSCYRPDVQSLEEAKEFARTLAPVRLKSHVGAEIPNLVTLFEVLGIAKAEELDPVRRWKGHDPNITMSVPVGKRAGGEIQHWDLQEEPPGETATLDKWLGPHSLVAGTTGAGKGELLRSLLLSLASHMHPHLVSFVLLDFKPPDLVDGLIQRLPHTVSTITRLSIERVPRALKGLEAELERRERLFDEAGKLSGQPVKDIRRYMSLHDRGVVSTKLPYLVLVVDEFTILKDELPEALDHFVKIAVAGRVFGFRMVLATQKPAGVVKGQIEANIKSRMCLMVTKPGESREVIGDTGAAYFRQKGRVRWRVKQETPSNFQCAWATAPYQSNSDIEDGQHTGVLLVELDGSRQALTLSAEPSSVQNGKTQYQVLIEHIAQVAEDEGITPLPGVWLQPLPDKLSVQSLRAPTQWDGQRWEPSSRWLSPVIGLLDDPGTQAQPLLQINLADEGHLFICSGTGDSLRLAVRTSVEQLLRDHGPNDLHLYLLDCGNAGLGVFKSFPHIGALIHLAESKRVRRLFGWLRDEVDRRRRWLDVRGYTSVAECRARAMTEDSLPALIVVIDNLDGLRSYFDLIGDDLNDLTSRGDEVGIHLLLASGLNVMTSIMFRVLNNVKRLRLALELDNPIDYKDVVGDYPDGLFLPRGVAGRGLCKSPAGVLECQVACGSDERGLVEMAKRMREVASRMDVPSPHPIQDLPEELDIETLLSGRIVDRWASHGSVTHVRVPLGVGDASLEPLCVDLEEDGPHFLVTGPKRGGKTTTLYTWVLALATVYPKEVVQFALFDTVTRSLAPLKGLPHLRGYGRTGNEHRDLLRDLRQIIERRETEGEPSVRPLIVVVVDDLARLALGSASVVSDLEDLARRGSLWGLHVILASDSGAISPYDALPKQVLRSGSGFFVGSHDIPHDGDIFGIIIPHPANKERLPPGRAYFLRHKSPQLMQVATPGDERSVEEKVGQIAEADTSYKPLG